MARPGKPPLASADDIEQQFYEALQQGDLDRLMAAWSDDDDIACIHPGGPRVVGPAAVRASFEALFAHGGSVSAQPERAPRPLGAQLVDDEREIAGLARVVEARQAVGLARAAAEVRQREAPPERRRARREGLRIVTRAGAFEPVEQRQQRRARRRRLAGPVDIDEVAVRRAPAFAPQRHRRAAATGDQCRPDRLRVAADRAGAAEPRRRAVDAALHQCRVEAASPASCISRGEPGLAWCSTMRQPWAVRA